MMHRKAAGFCESYFRFRHAQNKLSGRYRFRSYFNKFEEAVSGFCMKSHGLVTDDPSMRISNVLSYQLSHRADSRDLVPVAPTTPFGPDQ